MSMAAFYLPERDWNRIVRLTGEEAHHLQVLRLRPGDEVMLLDGNGKSGTGRILEITRKETSIELRHIQQAPLPESRPIIAIALSKAARRGFFLEKSAELGAWEIWLWEAERSQGEITEKLADSCRAQLRAGAKQCHNPWFPALRTPGDANGLAEKSAGCDWRYLPWEEKAGEPVISLEQLGRKGDTVYAIGPEGGLTESEVERLKAAGFAITSLGSRVLRCETAATLCLGLHWWASQLQDREQE